MSGSGPNQAVTEGSAGYNKLKRPDDFLTAVTAEPPSVELATESTKRTLDEADISNDEAKTKSKKRTRILARPEREDVGMRSMFPGMLDEDQLSDDSTTNAALAYLRDVRTEASSIPKLLLAPREPEEEDSYHALYRSGRGDHSVVYTEGTWIARDSRPIGYAYDAASDSTEDLDPQEHYYQMLIARYNALRKKIHGYSEQSQSADAQTHTSPVMATKVPCGRHEWRYAINREYPSPGLMWQMTENDIWHGIKYAAISLTGFRPIPKQKSCWIWALLASLPEYGTLDYTKVGVVRDLGHKAGQFAMALRSGGLNLSQGSHREYGDGPEDYKEDENGDGTEQRVEDAAPAAKDQEAVPVGGGIDMSMSEDEGEVQDDEPAKNTTIQPSPPGSIAQPSMASRPPFASRAHAELERQRLREQQLKALEAERAANPGKDAKQAGDRSEDEDDEMQVDEPATLEEARARLLAQLGDRLVQPAASPSDSERHRQQLSQELEMQEVLSKSEDQEPSLNEAKALNGVKPKADIGDVQIAHLNSKATIDMILTVVAECYGQKDLLRFRDVWVT